VCETETLAWSCSGVSVLVCLFFLLPWYLLDQIILLYGQGIVLEAFAYTPEFLRYPYKFA
jgi:hypothetical protein